MESTKTQNTSNEIDDINSKNSFFVSDSIKHLISEEGFSKNTSASDKHFTSDLIAEVTSAIGMYYFDVLLVEKDKSLQLKSDAHGLKHMLAGENLQVSLLLKKENVNLVFKCSFKQLKKIDNSAYIYTLNIL
jgi:hypothetical protein